MPPASQPTAGPTSEQLYAQGCARLEAGDPAAAIEPLSRAAAQSPDNLDYALKLARAQLAAGRSSVALRTLNGFVAKHPSPAGLRLGRAEVRAHPADWAVVEELLSPLEDQLDAGGLVWLAEACGRIGQVARATGVLQDGLARHPDSETLWLALIDRTLAQDQCGLALQRIRRAERHLAGSPRLEYRRAQAYFGLGRVLGATRVRVVPGGRVGQFADGWFLVEKRAEPDRFLCCPRASALYLLRRALDAGLDEPGAHRLHARIWEHIGRPEVGLAILQGREALWLEDAEPEMLEALADLALAANAIDDFLRYSRLRAAHHPQRQTEILYDAFVAAAERYNQRGDEAMYRELLKRALALKSEDVELMWRLGDAIWDTGDRDAAAVWYRRVLELEPAHRERSRILKRLGE